MLTCFCGDAESATLYDRLRARFPPLRDGVAPRSYVDAQCLYDQISPWGWRNYWKTNAMGGLGLAAIEALDEVFAEAASALSQIQLEHLHGALHRSAPELQPYLSGGAYPNYLFQETRERVRQAYGGDTYDRLVALKDRYDPANFFRLNQNIPPSGS